jgi:predicted RNase H-like HicB family nuclease
MTQQKFTVILTPELDVGGYVAVCPAIPGCISEGDTVEEALTNIKGAIEGCLESLAARNEPSPDPTHIIVATVETALPRTVSRYRQIVREKISALAAFINRHSHHPSAEAHAVIDEEHDLFLLVKTGWAGHRRERGTTLFLRLQDGKVWVEEDWTEEGISKELVQAGIAEEDIVLAFQSPEPRLLSEVTS